MIRREWESIVFQPVREDVPSPYALRLPLSAYFAGIDIADRQGVYSRRGQMGRFIGRSGNLWRTGKRKFLSGNSGTGDLRIDQEVHQGSAQGAITRLFRLYETSALKPGRIILRIFSRAKKATPFSVYYIWGRDKFMLIRVAPNVRLRSPLNEKITKMLEINGFLVPPQVKPKKIDS